MSVLTLRSLSYADSREEFRDCVDALHWQRESHPITSRGPSGEELTIDVAWSDERRELPTLIVSSGLHGVEGFFGAGLQRGLLESLRSRQFDLRGVRLVLMHAINPYGFAHVRRFDAENIDPNRNFLLSGEAFTGSPAGYAELDPLINPRTPTGACDWFYVRAALTLLRIGMPRLKQAIAAGQYEFPQGLFFGGHGPGETQRMLAQHLAQWVQGASRVVHFDLHSGLGPRGTAKLLIDSPLTTGQQEFLDQHVGLADYEVCHSEGVAYVARGGLGPWCVENAGIVDYLFACAEFGTYSPLRVLAGLRAENREHHWGQPGSPSYQRAKSQLKDLFYPDESASPIFMRWMERAIAGLSPTR
jgi:hypothetical protein